MGLPVQNKYISKNKNAVTGFGIVIYLLLSWSWTWECDSGFFKEIRDSLFEVFDLTDILHLNIYFIADFSLQNFCIKKKKYTARSMVK